MAVAPAQPKICVFLAVATTVAMEPAMESKTVTTAPLTVEHVITMNASVCQTLPVMTVTSVLLIFVLNVPVTTPTTRLLAMTGSSVTVVIAVLTAVVLTPAIRVRVARAATRPTIAAIRTAAAVVVMAVVIVIPASVMSIVPAAKVKVTATPMPNAPLVWSAVVTWALPMAAN
jgi:hypothetical protein